MNQAELNNIWVRWLDNRPVDEESLARLFTELQGDDSLADSLLNDLDMHRQLKALGNVEDEDFSFVGRMMTRFETETTTTSKHPVTPDQFASSDDLDNNGPPEFSGVIEIDPERTGRLKTVRANDQSGQNSRPDSGNRLKAWALVLCIPLMAGLLFAAFEFGKQSAQKTLPQTEPAESTESPKDGLLKQPPTLQRSGLTDFQDNPPGNLANPDVQLDDAKQRTDENQRVADNPPVDDEMFNGNALVEKNLPDSTFATVEEQEDVVWAIRPRTFPRLGTQSLELVSGQATIELDRGGAVSITGPAVFSIDRDFVNVESGQVTVDLPEFEDREYVIQVRGSRVQPKGNTRFALNVTPEGQSDLSIDRGAIQVEPWYANRQPGQAEFMTLSPNGFDHLVIDDGLNDRPAMARWSGPDEKFEGWVEFDGRMLRSESQPVISEVFLMAQKRFEESPDDLQREWQNLTGLLQDRPQSLNAPFGQLPQPDFEQMKQRIREMMEQMGQPGFEFPNNGNFQGGFSFEFNGDDMRLNKDNLPRDLQKKMLGSFADLFDELRKQGHSER